MAACCWSTPPRTTRSRTVAAAEEVAAAAESAGVPEWAARRSRGYRGWRLKSETGAINVFSKGAAPEVPWRPWSADGPTMGANQKYLNFRMFYFVFYFIFYIQTEEKKNIVVCC